MLRSNVKKDAIKSILTRIQIRFFIVVCIRITFLGPTFHFDPDLDQRFHFLTYTDPNLDPPLQFYVDSDLGLGPDADSALESGSDPSVLI
jgi:hypothetical protein